MKRNDYISWDEYFMGISLLSAQRSKDSHTQVGACIVSQDNKILSVGYNGMPTGCSDDEMPWDRKESFLTQNIHLCVMPNLTPFSTMRQEAYRKPRYMFHFFHATNVQRLSFKAA